MSSSFVEIYKQRVFSRIENDDGIHFPDILWCRQFDHDFLVVGPYEQEAVFAGHMRFESLLLQVIRDLLLEGQYRVCQRAGSGLMFPVNVAFFSDHIIPGSVSCAFALRVTGKQQSGCKGQKR